MRSPFTLSPNSPTNCKLRYLRYLLPLAVCLAGIASPPLLPWTGDRAALAQPTSTNPWWVANQLRNQGIQQYDSGQTHQALDTFQRELNLRRELGDRQGERNSLGWLGRIYHRLGQYEQATTLFQEALEIALEIGDRRGEGIMLNSIGFIYDSLGQYQEALDYYQRSLTVAQETDERQSERVTLNNIGGVYDSLGEYQEALGYYQRSLTITQELNDRQGESVILNNIGFIHQRLGQYQQALDYYQRSLTLAQEIGDRDGEGIQFNNIGGIYDNLGQYREALDYYQRSLVIAQEIGDRQGESIRFNNVGLIYEKLEQYQEALNYLQQSLIIAREIGDRQGEGRLLNNIGFIYDKLGRYEESLDYYQRSLIIAQEIRDRDGEARRLNNIGFIYGRLSQYQEALDYLQRSLVIFQALEAQEEIGVSLSNIGRSYAQQDQAELAIVFLKQSVNVRESIRMGIRGLSSDLQQSYTNTVTDDYRFLADLLLAQGRILEAQQVLELLKLEELREYSGTARGLEADTGIALNAVEEDILEQFRNLIAFGEEVDQCQQSRCERLAALREQRQRQSVRFNEQVNAFVQRIRDNRANDDFFYDPRRLNETARAIVAEPGTLLIYPVVLQDQLWLLYTSAGEVAAAVPVDVKQQQLGQTVVRFRDLLESPDSNLEELNAVGKQLYDWMIAPLANEIEDNRITTLVFAQDRVTRYIPMAALWDGQQYLVERFTLSTVLSAELTDMSDRLLPSPDQTSVLALGVSQAVLDFNALPNVESELDAIVRVDPADPQGIYPGLELLNDDFSFSSLSAHVLDHRILHIATHGKFVAGLPEESFLVLGDAKRLSIPDIERLGSDLADVHLVVLSACETAVGGPDADGIEVAGISSYFLAANRASAVMASLWLVNDASTSLLMRQFYENLAKGTMTKASALQYAQLALLNGELDSTQIAAIRRNVVGWGNANELSEDNAADMTPTLSHPYYWAPFVIVGNGL